MRENRSSGSVQGVMGNHSSYCDSSLREMRRVLDSPGLDLGVSIREFRV